MSRTSEEEIAFLRAELTSAREMWHAEHKRVAEQGAEILAMQVALGEYAAELPGAMIDSDVSKAIEAGRRQIASAKELAAKLKLSEHWRAQQNERIRVLEAALREAPETYEVYACTGTYGPCGGESSEDYRQWYDRTRALLEPTTDAVVP